MAARTSSQSGPWADSATWGGSAAPISGDTATISAGHTVTAATVCVCGTAPASAAVQLQVNGTLAFSSGGSVRVRGQIAVASGGTIDVKNGTLEVDGSAQATQQYQIDCVFQGGIVKSSSTQTYGGSELGIIQSNAGGLPLQIVSSRIDCQNVKFLRVGSASVRGFDNIPNAATDYNYFRYCRFDTCGSVRWNFTPSADTPYDFFHCTWTGSLAAPVRTNGGSSSTAALRRVAFCVFDEMPEIYELAGCTVTDNIFLKAYDYTGSAPASWARNFIVRGTGGVSANPGALIASDSYYLLQMAGHFVQGGAGSTFDGWIFEAASTAAGYEENDCCPANAGFNGTQTITNCIVLPNSADTAKASGCLGSLLGNSTTKYEYTHNTMHVGEEGNNAGGGTNLGETYSGTAGMVPVFKSNLGWTDTATGGYLINDIGGSTAADMVTLSGVTHNGKFNLKTGVGGVNGYDFPASSTGTAGVNDVTGDPAFVAKTRNLAAWDLSLGGAGTIANAKAQLAKLNDTDFNSAYSISALLTYVRGGFAPTNAAYHNTAHDGTDIGAVAYQAPASTGGRMGMRLRSRMRV